MILRVIDIETTGLEPPAEVIEIGWQDVELVDGVTTLGSSGSTLYGAANGVPPEARAVHHISPTELAGLAICTDADLQRAIGDADVIVAHHSQYECSFFGASIGDKPVVCTLKAALRVWPDAPAHSNSVLRYWLGLELDERAMPPHRALPDAYVTAHILVELLGKATIGELIAWTKEPRVMPKITFGKHRGARWSEVPADYLDWLVFKSELDTDTKWNARRELERRRKSA